MASFPNIRANRVNAQTVSANFFQGSNADISNIICDNLSAGTITSGSGIFNGNVVINSTTQSTSSTTGALVVAGGVGIGKNLNINGNLGITGYINIYNTLDANCLLGNTGSIVTSGGVTITKSLYVGGSECINGNLGVTGNANINGNLGVTGNANINGNLGVTGNANINGNLGVTGNANINGNLGVTGNANINGNLGVTGTINGAYLRFDNNSTFTYSINDNDDGTLGNYNTAMGYHALFENINGNNNTAIGYFAGATGSTGYKNVFVGSLAGTTGFLGTTGSVCVGYQSGAYTTGNFNTFLGYQTGYTGTNIYTGSNLTCIGKNAYPSAIGTSNEINLGNDDIGVLRCKVTTITAISDTRDKSDIEEIPVGIDLINQIQPSRFKWDRRDWYESGVSDGTKKADNWTPGFIAQQLDTVQTVNNAEYLNLVYKSNPERWEATPGNLLPVVIKALQDLSKENNELKARVDVLENKMISLNL